MNQPPKPVAYERLTEEQIRAATVAQLRVHGRPIQLVNYNHLWPELFRREALRIRAALG